MYSAPFALFVLLGQLLLPEALSFRSINPTAACAPPKGLGVIQATAFLPRIENLLQESMDALPTREPFKQDDSAKLAKIIFESMNTQGRLYHGIQHVFDISKTMQEPIVILAALFHDVIYFSIDKALTAEQQQLLDVVLNPEKTQQPTLADVIEDPVAMKVVDLFNFTPGDELKKCGSNEFLSTIVGVRALSKWLSDRELIQLAACIEATVPFRPFVDDKSPTDRLYDRLQQVYPEQDQEWYIDTVHKAVKTASCDLGSFDTPDLDYFLDSSWKLLPEARPVLLDENCPLIEFQNELKALEGRTKFLLGSVSNIFPYFQNSPSMEEIRRKEELAESNLLMAHQYSQVRLLQVMVLVDFFELMGEDPNTMPLRPILQLDAPRRSSGMGGATRAAVSPASSPFVLTTEEQQIRHWLVDGRRTCFPWDPAKAPFAAYLFDSLGPEGTKKAIEIGKNQEPGSYDLLKHLPDSVIRDLATSVATVLPEKAESSMEVPTRVEILAQWNTPLYDDNDYGHVYYHHYLLLLLIFVILSLTSWKKRTVKTYLAPHMFIAEKEKSERISYSCFFLLGFLFDGYHRDVSIFERKIKMGYLSLLVSTGRKEKEERLFLQREDMSDFICTKVFDFFGVYKVTTASQKNVKVKNVPKKKRMRSLPIVCMFVSF